jgi:hypothetical protein
MNFLTSYNVTNNSTCAAPAGVNGCVRDPSIAKFGSSWWVAHTCVAPASDVAEFCLTSSTDLQHWASPAIFVSTSSFSNSLSDLAPEWVKNPDGTIYLDSGSCPHITVDLSNKSNVFKIYETHPTDCADFSQPWTTPILLTVTGETTIFDPFMICQSPGGGTCTGTGDTFYLWYSHIDLGTDQNVQYASASTITGTYTRQSPGGDWIHGGINQEGPGIIKLSNRWRVWFDKVPAPPGDIADGQLYYSDSFDNWTTWTVPAPMSSQGIQIKHGTIIPYP